MNGPSDASARPRRFEVRSILLWFQRNTIVALLLLLLLFIAIVELMKPGTVNPVWLSNTLLFAAPLGILAAGQTMVMLTGGIDLSVVSVATGSAFLMTTTALKFGNVTAVAIGLGLGLAVGAINGVDVALLGVQPLVMTLGTGLMTQASSSSTARGYWHRARSCPTSRHRIRSPGWPHSSRRISVVADCGAGGGNAGANRLRPPVIRDRR